MVHKSTSLLKLIRQKLSNIWIMLDIRKSIQWSHISFSIHSSLAAQNSFANETGRMIRACLLLNQESGLSFQQESLKSNEMLIPKLGAFHFSTIGLLLVQHQVPASKIFVKLRIQGGLLKLIFTVVDVLRYDAWDDWPMMTQDVDWRFSFIKLEINNSCRVCLCSRRWTLNFLGFSF